MSKTYIYFTTQYTKEFLISLVTDSMKHYINWRENPNLAYIFDSLNEAENFAKKYIVNPENIFFGTIDDLQSEIYLFEKWILSGCIKTQSFVVNNEFSRPYNGESIKEILTFHKEYYDFYMDTTRESDYNTWPEICDVCHFIFDVAFEDSVDIHNGSTTFSLIVKDDLTYNDFISEIKLLKSVANVSDSIYPNALVFHTLFLDKNIDFPKIYFFDDNSYTLTTPDETKFFTNEKDFFEFLKSY